jgi:hypothetical protein
MDWKRKLTSRKFWTAVAEFVSMMVVAFGGTEETSVKIVALIMAGAGVIAYIVGEGLTDAAAVGKEDYVLIDEPENENEEVKSDVD